MLSKPILALTKNRTQKAQVNPVCGDPEAWFITPYFKEMGVNSASFDFFVDWEKEKVCDEVWIKRISDSDDIQSQSEEELIELILRCDGRDYSKLLYRFLQSQRMKGKYMLFRDVPEEQWENGSERVVELDMSQYKHDSVSRYDAVEIQEKIKQLRKRPASIGNAGLIYSTSTLEGYLSKKEYFWPGDVDTVLYDSNNKVIAILEFKKHTQRSMIPFKKQALSNYLQKDILKYKSLALLRNRFNTRLFVLYYPIPSNIKNIIIEEVNGQPDSLFASRRIKLDLPDIRDNILMKAFADKFMKLVINNEEDN